jgi:DNA-binding GntR family transcriptional regulator
MQASAKIGEAREPPSLQGEGAYWRLLQEIRTGQLPAGARLTETELADRLAISRTPVREAIRRLEADGLVRHEPRVGAMVRSLDYAEVMELYEMRSVLEGTAARMAARSASEVEIAELAAINDEMASVPEDPQRLAALNQRFHLTLIDAARNRYLVKSVQSVHKVMLILGPTTLEEAGRARAAMAEHAEVLAALSARDGLAAEAAMRRHMDAAHRARLRQIRARAGRDGWERET